MAAIARTWTPTTLAAQLIGEISQDQNAAGGSVPNRMLADVVTAAAELWEMYPWKFRRRRTALTITTGDVTEALPADFEKFDLRWLKENNDRGPVSIIEDEEVFERYRDATSSAPRIAIVEPAEDLTSGFSWILRFNCPASEGLTLQIVYYCTAPELEADDTPPWPGPFHELWEFLARVKAYYQFRSEQDADRVYRHVKGLMERAKTENDESMRTQDDTIRDDVGDLGALASSAWLYGRVRRI